MSTTAETTASYHAYTSRNYMPELDGLRAISVLLVISCHMADQQVWHWLAGHLGVTIFFILSGYLITTLALREERRNGRLSLRAFYVRRGFRILPAYYCVLALYCLLIVGLGWGQTLRANFIEALPSYLFYYQDFSQAWLVVGEGKRSPFAHSWTLGIEEKFYLIWPMLAFVLWRGRAIRMGGTIALALLFLLAGSLYRLSEDLTGWHLGVVLYPYWQILVGCVLAILLDRERWFARLRVLGTAMGSLLTLGLFLSLHLAYPHVSPGFPEIHALYTLATAGLIASLVTGAGWLQRVLRVGGLVFLGKLSYGMYLLHGLGISIGQKLFLPQSGRIELSLLAFLVASACTAIAAYGLAVLVEQPCIRLGKRCAAGLINGKTERDENSASRGAEPDPDPVATPNSSGTGTVTAGWGVNGLRVGSGG